MKMPSGICKRCGAFKAFMLVQQDFLIEKSKSTLVKHAFIFENNIMYKSICDLSEMVFHQYLIILWPKGAELEIR